jgi:hypothetical protein
MLTIRCTQKLLRRLNHDRSPPASTTRLGDWYANILFRRPEQLILCMSERTLLPVIIPARDASRMGSRLSEALAVVLARLGVRETEVQDELAEMNEVAFGPTKSKKVLGSLNDFMFRLSVRLEERPSASPIDTALWLADTPCGAIAYDFPDRLTRETFSAAGGAGRTVR